MQLIFTFLLLKSLYGHIYVNNLFMKLKYLRKQYIYNILYFSAYVLEIPENLYIFNVLNI